MAKLEDLKRGAAVKGILPDCLVTVVDVRWYGSAAIELTYKDPVGRPNVVLLYRDREPTLEVGEAGRPWSFDGDGNLFRLVSEAHRINLAYLFDPLLAIHTSVVDPLPHQITGVYGEMLPRQPLRFLLADDPGAGKTIMAGLLIKELLIRGDGTAPEPPSRGAASARSRPRPGPWRGVPPRRPCSQVRQGRSRVGLAVGVSGHLPPLGPPYGRPASPPSA